MLNRKTLPEDKSASYIHSIKEGYPDVTLECSSNRIGFGAIVLNTECSESATRYGGSVSLNIIPCKIFDQSAFVLRTDATGAGRGDHPRNIVEVAAEVKLRDRFGLKDDDQVELWLP